MTDLVMRKAQYCIKTKEMIWTTQIELQVFYSFWEQDGTGESSRSFISLSLCALNVLMEDHGSSSERSFLRVDDGGCGTAHDWQLKIARAQLAFHGLDFHWEA